ncbi:hypothetical protein SC206_18430 [Rouxiella sp. T17]|uniref:hypothetical protein n=1 Tax=Rouxiella sp. T17 TaxID=3085684 RepID=UPI002FC73AEA
MGGISQHLKATITFGGKLTSSWSQSTAAIKKNLKTIEQQSQKLTKQQKQLAEQIKKAKLAGKDISSLKRDYSNVTKEIKKASAAQSGFNRDLQQVERVQGIKGMAGGIMAKAFSAATSAFSGSINISGGGSGLVSAAIGALVSPIALNAKTTEKAGKARSYGVGVETYNAWDSLGKQFGLDGDHFGDLFEEYLHKSGEYKQTGKQGSLQEAFETLGFGAGALAGLSDIQQFDKIIERALSLKDESKSSFALDSLFGGESSKVLMLIKRSGQSYQDLINEQKRYNLVTQQGADGAKRGNLAVNNLTTVLSSSAEEIAGALGNELAPQIQLVATEMAAWFKNGGISSIVRALHDDWYPQIISFGNGLIYVGKIAFALAKKLSWLLPNDRENKKSILQNLAMGGSVDIARLLADKRGLKEWFAEKVDKPEVIRDLRNQWAAGEDKAGFWKSHFMPDALQKRLTQGLLEEIDGKAGESFSFDFDTEVTRQRKKLNEDEPTVGQWPSLMQRVSEIESGKNAMRVEDNRHQALNINISTQPGQDAHQLADTVINEARRADIFNGNNALYDVGSNW